MKLARIARRGVSLLLLSLFAYVLAGCGTFGINLHSRGAVGHAFGGNLGSAVNWTSHSINVSSHFVHSGVLRGLSPTRFAGRFVRSLIEQGNAPRPEQLTAEQQYYLGRGVSAALVDEFSMADPALPEVKVQLEYLNGMAGFLYSSSSDGASLWAGVRVGLLDSNEVAAYATPGGYVWVTRGAIDMCESEDELAALMAHELGHMSMEHSIAAYHQDNGGKVRVDLALLEAAAGGASDVDPNLGSYVKGHAQRVRDDPYTEDQEYEADRWAVVALQLSGYEPEALQRLMDRVEQWEKANPDSSRYLKNHPPVSRRKSEIQAFTSQNSEMFTVEASAEAKAAQNARFTATFGG